MQRSEKGQSGTGVKKERRKTIKNDGDAIIIYDNDMVTVTCHEKQLASLCILYLY